MNWTIRFSEKAEDQFKKLDKSVQIQILKYLKRFEGCQNPRLFGEKLSYNYAGFWRYRVGNYRIICTHSLKQEMIIYVIEISHRKNIYE